ncbi:MAG: DinB family protein [Acidobacteria bacterium]|nr:DinB family protein [Acidobacteriota bacterium]
MEELWAYRQRLLERHAAQVSDLRARLAGWPDDRVRVAPRIGEWSAHQVAAHLRDVEVQAYIPRVHRTLAEADPSLADFDAEAFMAGAYDPAEPIEQIVEDVEQARQGLRRVLALDDGLAWSRTGRHPALGRRTVQTWVERAVDHFEEHLQQLDRAVATKVPEPRGKR